MLALISLSAFALSTVELSPPDSQASKAVGRPLVVLTGIDSHYGKTAFHRVDSADELLGLWGKHRGPGERQFAKFRPPMLTVDFDHCTVVAIFQVEKQVTLGLRVVAVEDAADRVTLRYENLSVAVRSRRGERAPPPEVTPAFAFVVLPKTTKPIVLEEDVRSAKNTPPEWKERARLRMEDGM